MKLTLILDLPWQLC